MPLAGSPRVCYSSWVNGIFHAAKDVAEFMSERGWEFCVIGGLAVQRWGEPRTTLDADLTLLTGIGQEEQYATALLARFSSRLPDALAFALSRRVLLLSASNGTAVDISFGALGFEEDMVRRAVPTEFAPGIILPCCTAEDLVVMKAFASRPRDWLDVESVVARQEPLDHAYILRQLTILCELKEAPEIVERTRNLLTTGVA